MSFTYPARVEESLTVTGTGSITTGSTPVSGAQTFANACTVGDSFPLYIVDTTTSPITIEQSIGTYSAANTITRTALPGQSLTSFAGNQCNVLVGQNPAIQGQDGLIDPTTLNWVGNELTAVYANQGAWNYTFPPSGVSLLFPFLLPVSGLVSAISWVVKTASTTSGSGCLVGLMAPTSGSSASSFSLVIDFTSTTAIDLTTTGVASKSDFTAAYLPAGLYMLQIVQNATGANGGLLVGTGVMSAGLGMSLTSSYGLGTKNLISGSAGSQSALLNPFTSSDLVNTTSKVPPLFLLGITG